MHAHGKLLISGEYLVLDGALALAAPSRLGQSLGVVERPKHPEELIWQSMDHEKQAWFTATWLFSDNKLILKQTTDKAIARRLLSIFEAAFNQNSATVSSLKGKAWTTYLDFPREWGLGTSSTLISLLAEYWHIDPYRLLAATFGGSAYDIACATAQGPILYQKKDGQPSIKPVNWNPAFKEQLFFVYQGQKQNSREGILRYRSTAKKSPTAIADISHLATAFLQAETASDFGRMIREHETIISHIIQLPKVKEARFKDFPGEIKSLGAWGGDFIMALSPWDKINSMEYFNRKNCPVILSFEEMIKQ